MIRTLLAAAAALAVAGPVGAQTTASCQAPVAPQPASLSPQAPEPTLPKCVNKAKGTHTCRGREIDQYNDKMAAHNAGQRSRVEAFNAYSAQLESYFKGATTYVNCESNRLKQQFSPTPDS